MSLFNRPDKKTTPRNITDNNEDIVEGKNISQDGLKLRTTHIAPNAKPRTIATLAVINGELALAYIRSEQIESYITVEEIFKWLIHRLPRFTVNF